MQAVHHLASQAVDSNHLLLGDIDAITHFHSLFKDDVIVGPLFQKLVSNITFCTVPSSVTFYMEVVSSTPIQRVEGDVTIQQMHYTHFSSLDASIKTTVIGEDLNDVAFFDHILQWFITSTHANLHYNFHPMSGGGKNTYKVVTNELDANHITICIIDTDIKYPGYVQAPDTTYPLCAAVGAGVVFYKFLPLSVHEIENIIPLNYIDAFDVWTEGTAEDARNKAAFDALRSRADEILPYFDYKKGIHKTTEFTSSADYMDLAEKCFSCNISLKATYPDFTTYLAHIPDKGIVYNQLIGGSGILTRTLDLIKMPTCPAPLLEPFQEYNWKEIGQNMLNWCIARDRESLN